MIKRCSLKAIVMAVLVSVSLFSSTFSVSAASISSEEQLTVETPQIQEFNVDRTYTIYNDPEYGTVHASWKVTGDVKYVYVISNGKFNDCLYEAVDEGDFGFEETGPITIYVTAANGEVIEKSIQVEVMKDYKTPTIDEFAVDKTSVTKNDGPVNAHWNISGNVKEVYLEGYGKGPDVVFKATDEVALGFEKSSTLTLTAIGYKGEVVTKSIDITVMEETYPSVSRFTASKTTIQKGRMVELSWETENADSIMLICSNPNRMLNVPSCMNSVYVTPNKTTTYILLVNDANGNVEAKGVTITVNK